jgi:hypothetical protein
MVVVAAIPRTLRRFIVFFEFNNQGLFADSGAAKTPRLSLAATAFNTYLQDPQPHPITACHQQIFERR